MTTPCLLLHLVAPAALVLSRVNSRWIAGATTLDLRIDRTGVKPFARPPLLEAGIRTLAQFVPLMQAPVVRYYMERDIPERRLMHMDLSPFQVDVFLRYDLMSQDLADELAGHYTNALRCRLP